jgi:hypothetical protein
MPVCSFGVLYPDVAPGWTLLTTIQVVNLFAVVALLVWNRYILCSKLKIQIHTNLILGATIHVFSSTLLPLSLL